MTTNEPNVKLYYRYCALDKRHEYQIVCREDAIAYKNHWYQWLWFFLGALFTVEEKNRFQLLPYEISYEDNNKLLASYRGNNAKKVAGFVHAKIMKHLNERGDVK